MNDQSQMRLGRKAIKTDSRTLRLNKFLAAFPTPPASADWTAGVTNWGMMLNDTLGDCTIAGIGHAVQVWTANTGGMVTVPDATIESYYEKWDGYVPGDASTDSGGVELDVLTNWRKQGLDGHALLGFADPNFRDLDEVRTAIDLFGGVYIGLNLPLSAQNQTIWDAPTERMSDRDWPGSWGGHAVFVPAYDVTGFTCITWGTLQKMTVGFWDEYVDEAHALLSPDWIAKNVPPGRFDLNQLQADLALIR